MMNRLFWLLGLSLCLVFVGCNDDDDNDDNGGSGGPATGYSFINTEVGSSLELTLPGGDPTQIGSDFISDDFDGGQLLNLNYFRQITIGTTEGSFFLRWNFPQNISASDTIVNTFGLYNFPLLLQDTGNLSEIIVEFYKPGTQDGEFLDGNAAGSVTLLRDVNTPLGMYSMVGEIDAVFNVNGQQTTVIGTFWNKDFQW
jgi:hypothetical protein